MDGSHQNVNVTRVRVWRGKRPRQSTHWDMCALLSPGTRLWPSHGPVPSQHTKAVGLMGSKQKR